MFRNDDYVGALLCFVLSLTNLAANGLFHYLSIINIVATASLHGPPTNRGMRRLCH